MEANPDRKEGKFIIFETANKSRVSLTVALPAFNAENIIWLALESLSNQNVDKGVYWELIVCEEFGLSKVLVQKYANKLKRVNCAKLTYISINPKKEGLFKGVYLLLEKWVRMANTALPSSKALVLMACDIYAHPKRIMIHYNHFKNNDCIVSTQPIGPFYNIKTGKIFIYDGNLLSKTKTRHLNMAFRLNYIKKVSIVNKRRSIDTHILDDIKKMMKGKFDHDKNIYYDNSTNWKYGFDTDGCNNISLTRKRFYETPEAVVNRIILSKNSSPNQLRRIFDVYWCLPLYNSVKRRYNYDSLTAYIPKYVVDRLTSENK